MPNVNKAYSSCSLNLPLDHTWVDLKSILMVSLQCFVGFFSFFFFFPLAFSFLFIPVSAHLSLSSWCYATGGSFCSWRVLVQPTSPCKTLYQYYCNQAGEVVILFNYLSCLCNVVSLRNSKFKFPGSTSSSENRF